MSIYLAKESKKDLLPPKLTGGMNTNMNMNMDDDDEDEDEEEEDEDDVDMKDRGGVRAPRIYGGDDDEDEDPEGDPDDEDPEGDPEPDDDDEEEGDPDNIVDPAEAIGFHMDDEEDEDEEDADPEDDDGYLQKFEEGMKKNIIADYHPEMKIHNYDEIDVLCRVTRDSHGTIVCPLHQTLPILTKYELAKVLGERALQIANGSAPMVDVGPEVIDPYLLAREEMKQKAIPFIIKRPIGNRIEYWRLSDLENLHQ